jgi:coenzyme F420-0:L-glutamate ligase/coenzyme F420-1:gamma-L-glutamate ligase
MLSALALEGLPEISAGDDLAQLLAAAMPEGRPQAGDVLVIAHKVVSKCEGRTRRLSSVAPTTRAAGLATMLGKDPRHVQVVLDETREVRRADHGVLIAVTHHGFVCANAGVDASNAPDDDTLILLPTDPDRSARHLRDRLRMLTGHTLGVLVTDSFGRAWRHGQCDVAIGAAGLQPLEDWRGRSDARGRELKATWIAVADQLAGAADLARAKDARQPAVLIAGAQQHVTEKDGPGAVALLRDPEHDLFR